MRSPPPQSCALGICLVRPQLLAFGFTAAVKQFCRPSSALQQALFKIATPVFTVN